MAEIGQRASEITGCPCPVCHDNIAKPCAACGTPVFNRNADGICGECVSAVDDMTSHSTRQEKFRG